MPNRRKLRECAVQILYGLDFYGELSADRAVNIFLQGFSEEFIDDPYLRRVVVGTWERRDEIDGVIRQYSTNWRLERMAVVDRNILRMAAFELLHMREIPRKVSINEAIEVAKRFGGEDSPSFINGILDRVALEVRGAETPDEKALGEAEAASLEESNEPLPLDLEDL